MDLSSRTTGTNQQAAEQSIRIERLVELLRPRYAPAPSLLLIWQLAMSAIIHTLTANTNGKKPSRGLVVHVLRFSCGRYTQGIRLRPGDNNHRLVCTVSDNSWYW